MVVSAYLYWLVFYTVAKYLTWLWRKGLFCSLGSSQYNSPVGFTSVWVYTPAQTAWACQTLASASPVAKVTDSLSNWAVHISVVSTMIPTIVLYKARECGTPRCTVLSVKPPAKQPNPKAYLLLFPHEKTLTSFCLVSLWLDKILVGSCVSMKLTVLFYLLRK